MLEKSFLLPYPHTRACIAFGPKGGDARGHGTAVHGVANICRRGVYRYALHSMQILMPIVSDSAAEAKPVGLTDGDAGEAAGGPKVAGTKRRAVGAADGTTPEPKLSSQKKKKKTPGSAARGGTPASACMREPSTSTSTSTYTNPGEAKRRSDQADLPPAEANGTPRACTQLQPRKCTCTRRHIHTHVRTHTCTHARMHARLVHVWAHTRRKSHQRKRN